MKLSLIRHLTFSQSHALEFPLRGGEQEVILARESLPPDWARHTGHWLQVITILTLIRRHAAVLQSAGRVTACSMVSLHQISILQHQNWSRSNENFTLSLKTAVDCSQELCRLRRASKSDILTRPGWDSAGAMYSVWAMNHTLAWDRLWSGLVAW